METKKRLIDANGSYTLNANDNTEHSLCFGGGIISVMDQRGHCICEFDAEDAPTVDAVEVVHGRWIEYSHLDVGGECSVCGWQFQWFENDEAHYCPHCGAKMDMEGD